MELLKWIFFVLCILSVAAQAPEPESSPEPSSEPEPSGEPEPEPVDPEYYGTSLGPLSELAHGVSGDVYIVSEKRLMITNFNYDGAGPDAYFYVGTSGVPIENGVIIPNEEGSTDILEAYVDKMVILKIPDDMEMSSIRWFSVWCRQAGQDFGSVMIPANTPIPMPREIEMFSGTHNVMSGTVTILDHKRIEIVDFHFDGAAPDTFFYVGTGNMPTAGHHKIPDEDGSMEKLEAYNGETIVLTLPVGLTFFNIDWLSIWCDEVSVNFGHVMIPDDLLVPVNLQSLMMTHMDNEEFLGVWVGMFERTTHDVSGHLYIVDNTRIRLVEFNYDGAGPDAFFYVGFSDEYTTGDLPDGDGTIINNERGRREVLMSYDMADIVLTLPEGRSVHDVVWISVWCRDFAVDFGHVIFPMNLPEIPEKTTIAQGFTEYAHDVRSGAVTFLDEKRVHIMDLYYDGTGPDAFFWVGLGAVDGSGWAIPNEFGSLAKLERYDGKTVTLTLPEDYTWYDVDYLSIWCRQAGANFGEVIIPDDMFLPPFVNMEESLANCQQFHDYFLVNWEIIDDYIYYEFAGALEGEDGYMSFGRSGSSSRSSMFGADVFVAYWNNGQAHVDDYSLTNYAQCNIATGEGACPDEFNGGTNNAEIIKFKQVDGITMVKFRRPLMTGEPADLDTPMDGDMFIVWAMGVLGDDGYVTKHNLRMTDFDVKLMSGLHCEGLEPREETNLDPWEQEKISDETMLVAQIGPAGGDRGYKAITGSQSWGIAWWINGFIIPEIVMERGKTYTFKVEGGDDVNNNAEYHPFYITDDSEGGYAQKSMADKARETVFAGVDASGQPTAAGRFCEYKPINGRDEANNFERFEDYKQSLFLDCDDSSEPAYLEFTPDENTPDTIYYQCYTHRFLGWRITVVDSIMPTVGSAVVATPTVTTISLVTAISMLLCKLLFL